MIKLMSLMLILLFPSLLLVGCGGGNTKATTEKTDKLVIYCPHPLTFINPLVSEFEKQSGIKVEVVAAGSGELLKRVESEKANPLGDIFWGGSLGTMKPKANLFENYTSANEDKIQQAFKNTEGSLTRFTDIPSVIMVNTNLIGDMKMEGYEDLLNPKLKGKIAFSDPSKSSSSYEHLINMLYAMGKGDPEKGWDYVKALCANLDGKLLSGSSAVYKGVADGEYAVGCTFEEGGAKYVADGAPVKLVYMKEGVISKPDGVYVIKNAKNMTNAKKFIDFITSKDAQTIIVQQLHRRSVRDDVEPPKGLIEKSKINIINDDEKVVVANQRQWLDNFKDIFTSVN
ncbi:ABC transporter substrate-binding protein [Pelosinus baikalensis]|uniref:ABC transporter substrate-binding protein n=1 Tax=Pelosinus baikalensis TaxID=2892015 RepID=A0ABS8HQA2_9FIRM|nr:ABC transporter substrate-binding protein [Pelosinus baikalensis]MCC5465348.1 ABC transporter substrate-binding protein [Pelosinus baikalensis]